MTKSIKFLGLFCLIGIVSEPLRIALYFVERIIYPHYTWRVGPMDDIPHASNVPVPVNCLSMLIILLQIITFAAIVAVCVICWKRVNELLYIGMLLYAVFRLILAVYSLLQRVWYDLYLNLYVDLQLLMFMLAGLYMLMLITGSWRRSLTITLGTAANIAAVPLSIVLALAHAMDVDKLYGTPAWETLQKLGLAVPGWEVLSDVFLGGVALLGVILCIYGFILGKKET